LIDGLNCRYLFKTDDFDLEADILDDVKSSFVAWIDPSKSTNKEHD